MSRRSGERKEKPVLLRDVINRDAYFSIRDTREKQHIPRGNIDPFRLSGKEDSLKSAFFPG